MLARQLPGTHRAKFRDDRGQKLDHLFSENRHSFIDHYPLFPYPLFWLVIEWRLPQIEGNWKMTKWAKVELDTERGVAVFNWENGEIDEYALDDLPRATVNALALGDKTGLKPTLVDSYSSATEKGWEISDCRDAVRERWETILSGDWTARDLANETVRAISAVHGVTLKMASDAWKKADEATKTKIKKEPKIIAAIAREKLEKAEKRAEAAGKKTDRVDYGKFFGPTAK
jgi:hypothetical protein